MNNLINIGTEIEPDLYPPVYTNTRLYKEKWHEHVFKCRSSNYEFISYSELITLGVAVTTRIEAVQTQEEIESGYIELASIKKDMRKFGADFREYMWERGLPIFNSIEEAREYNLV